MANQKLEMFRGDYREFPVLIAEPYQPLAQVHFAVKPKTKVKDIDAADTNALFTINATGALNGEDNGDGTMTITLVFEHELTKDKAVGSYTAEIEYINQAGQRTTYPQFDFELKPDVNQRV